MTRLIVCVLGLTLFFSSAAWAENPSPSGDPFIGDYEGTYRSKGRPDYSATAKVISEGRGLYRLLVQYAPPSNESWTYQVELHGQSGGPRLFFNGYSNADRWEGTVRDGKLSISNSYLPVDDHVVNTNWILTRIKKSGLIFNYSRI